MAKEGAEEDESFRTSSAVDAELAMKLLEEERGPQDDARPILPDESVLSALAELDAETDPASLLTAEERHQLDTLGYLCLGQLLSEGQVDEMARRIDAQLVAEGDDAGTEVHTEEGAQRMSDLNNKPELNHDGLFGEQPECSPAPSFF